jgi:putative yapH protein|nr:MAG TPA: putative tail fiber protein [Caudoviricetes sp.]
MEHITNVLVYSNRCEVLDSHVFTVGDKGFPHIRLKFIYMFGAETLEGKQLELKYILPDKSYQVETISVTGENEVLFPIHYSVFVNGGWTTLKITIVEGANRITLDDIIIKTKKLEAEQEFQHKDVKAIVQTEITKISKKIKEFEEETKIELNTLKTNLSQNLETEKNSSIEALKEAYTNEMKKLDVDVKKVVTKYLKENTDTFNGEITALTNLVNNKENAFSKNTAFNKNFGTTADTVLEGNKLDEINEKFKTVNNGIDAKFKGVAGGKVNLNFIQDPGEKIEGEYYLDKTSGKLHRCIKRTSSTVNSAEYFKDYSLEAIIKNLESLTETGSNEKGSWFKDKRTGLIIQWGFINLTVTKQDYEEHFIDLPIPFPNSSYNTSAARNYYYHDISDGKWSCVPISNNKIKILTSGFTSNLGKFDGYFWIAIGK